MGTQQQDGDCHFDGIDDRIGHEGHLVCSCLIGIAQGVTHQARAIRDGTGHTSGHIRNAASDVLDEFRAYNGIQSLRLRLGLLLLPSTPFQERRLFALWCLAGLGVLGVPGVRSEVFASLPLVMMLLDHLLEDPACLAEHGQLELSALQQSNSKPSVTKLPLSPEA